MHFDGINSAYKIFVTNIFFSQLNDGSIVQTVSQNIFFVYFGIDAFINPK